MSDLDSEIRQATFDWLNAQPQEAPGFAEMKHEDLSAGFVFARNDERIHILQPYKGIAKPKPCEFPISISTTLRSSYDDDHDASTGLMWYAYSEKLTYLNDGLRGMIKRQIPLIYCVQTKHDPRLYAVRWPAYICFDDNRLKKFVVKIPEDRISPDEISESSPIPVRYKLNINFRRVHQKVFRGRVLDAYRKRCTMCRLGHLLEASHIKPDSEEGLPEVSNGLALCKLHHGAYDSNLVGINPTGYKIVVRDDIMHEKDGLTLTYSLQKLNGNQIDLPVCEKDHPNKILLGERWQVFKA